MKRRCARRERLGRVDRVSMVRVLIPMVVMVATAMVLAACSDATVSSSADLGSVPIPEGPSSSDTEGTPEPIVEPTPTLVPLPTPTPQGPLPLLITTVMGETGVMAPLDGPAVAGVMAAVDQLNAAGGVLGRQIAVRRIDINSRVSLAERHVERLLEGRPPDLLIVSCETDFSKPVLDMADAAGLVTISPCSDDPGYSSGSWGSRNFTLGAPAESRGAAMAEVAFPRYGATAMVLRDVTSPEALRFCNGFERAFREIGGSIDYRDQFSYDTLEPLRDRLVDRRRDTTLIAVCSHVPGGIDAAPSIISMVRNVGFDAPIVSGSTVDEPLWFSAVPDLGDMSFITWSSVFGNDPEPEINDLIRAASRDAESPVPGVTTVLGADSVAAWARAVEAARSVDPARVSAAMASFSNEEFLTGSITFVSGARMDPSRTYRVVRVSGAEIEVPELVTTSG